MINCAFENGNKASLRHVTVGVIIEKDNKILLIKRDPKFSEGGKWDTPGGFLNRDETASEGAAREVLEETGWKCEITTLLKINSNPNRPKEDRQNVELSFIAKALEKVSEPDNESTEVRWVSFDEIKGLGEIAFDKAETIDLYLKYKDKPFDLPLFI